jgi:cyclomaltodextrinase
MSTFETPGWVHDAVFYQIFPDRFAASSQVPKPGPLEPWDAPPTTQGFKGGDLVGVAEHLDYLVDLGITALYLTPIFQSASNHRYHTHDYFQVDPLLGGRSGFDRLLEEAHRRDIRVVLDGVFNHASRGFFPFNHILETGRRSPYLDWFRIKGFPLHAYEGRPGYECWWNLAALPSFNHANRRVQEFIFDVARYWVDQGIDGWRLDVASEIREPGFWQEFRRVVKSRNPQAYITGEIAGDATPWLQGDQFDAVMNYLATYACWSFFGGTRMKADLVRQWRVHGNGFFVADARSFADAVTGLLSKYPRPAVLFQMTYPGAPCVYYGDEIGMEGGNDPDCRRAFPWDEGTWDLGLRDHYRRCIRLRRRHPSLRDGSWDLLKAEDGAVVYLRKEGGDAVVVALNNAGRALPIDVPVRGLLPDGARLSDELGARTAVVRAGRLGGASLPPFSGAAFVRQQDGAGEGRGGQG